MNLTLDKLQRTKLLELCVRYFPKTKMTVYQSTEGYKGHCIYFETKSDNVNSWLVDEDNIVDSPNVILKFNQHEDNSGIKYTNTITLHWYDLCMDELSDKIYKLQYENRMKKLFNSNMHVVDFMYKDYLEECDMNIF